MNAIKIVEAEIRLADKKEHLEKFQPEFCELKKKFEADCQTLQGTDLSYSLQGRRKL
jgi:hypothetical protein